MDNPGESPAVLSLCTGYGGLEIGLERALNGITGHWGLNVRAHVEIEAFAVANLVNKMETGRMVPAPIWSDLKTLNAEIFRDGVDILTGGYPCQPFSAAGKRGGTDDPRHLWPFIGGTVDGRKNIIEQCRPRWVFFENVEGHLSLGIGEVLADLEKMGYRVAVGIFSAAEVGAPHQRKRVFILGARVDDAEGGEPVVNPKNTRQVDGHGDLFGLAGPARGGETLAHGIGPRQPQSGGTLGKIGERAVNGGEKLGNAQGHDERRDPHTEHGEGFQARGSGGDVADSGPGRSEQSGFKKWPARPGEPQHEWEEPRVIMADTESRGGGDREECTRRIESDHEGETWKTQPRMGGAVDGPPSRMDSDRNRVDRLRLLGNGVVPQVAEKAFLTLHEKLKNDN